MAGMVKETADDGRNRHVMVETTDYGSSGHGMIETADYAMNGHIEGKLWQKWPSRRQIMAGMAMLW